MKKVILIAVVAVCVAPRPCDARVFFAGSNPMLTIFAFPQDIFLIPQDFVFYQTTFQSQPWWGDIDQPDLKPSTTYLLTGEEIGVKGGNNYFQHNANLYNWRNIAGFTRTYSPLLKMRFDLEYAWMPLMGHAEGAFSDTANHWLRFKYDEALSVHDVYLTSYCATKWRGIPLGFKLGLGRLLTVEPTLDWNITENDTNYTAHRYVWGWSTMQGGRIFATYPGADHGRYQDEYSIGSMYQFDVQAAATLTRLKFGARLRHNFGKLSQFVWQPDTSAPVSDSLIRHDMTGSYANATDKKIGETTFRAYGNYNWIQRDKLLFNTLVLSRYTVVDSEGVLPQNANVSIGELKQSRTFVFQINPNVNIYPWDSKRTYIDLAILCNYSHMSYDFTRPWGVGGGEKESYVNTYVQPGEDYAWYDFSYARQNFFEVALDANPTFPIYGNARQSVAMSISTLLWTRFKWISKYYGESHTSATDVTFDVANIRKNFEREVWLNSVLHIIYRRNSWMYKLTFGQPLTYSLSPVTRVYDASGKNLISEVRHHNMWVSQAGALIGFFASTSLDNFASWWRPAKANNP